MDAQLGNKKVIRFEEIILWPLRLRPSTSDEPVDLEAPRRRLAEALSQAPWTEPPGPFQHRLFPDDPKAHAQAHHLHYASAVYFHEFVRQFLYAPAMAEDTAWGVRFFHRPDIQSVSFRLFMPGGKSPVEVTLATSIEAWLFEPDILLVVVRFSNCRDGVPGDPIRLDVAQQILNCVRRLYPPFFKDGVYPGHFPEWFQWFTDARPCSWREVQPVASVPADAQPRQRDDYYRHLEDTGEPRLASHWDDLLPKNSTDSAWRLTTLGDEGAPVLAYLSFRDPKALSQQDLARLVEADEPGPSDAWPYARQFAVKAFHDDSYTRFWGGAPMPPGWTRTSAIPATPSSWSAMRRAYTAIFLSTRSAGDWLTSITTTS